MLRRLLARALVVSLAKPYDGPDENKSAGQSTVSSQGNGGSVGSWQEEEVTPGS